MILRIAITIVHNIVTSLVMSNFFATIKARKSVRNYLPKSVEKSKLKQIAEAAFESPSAGPVFVSVVTNPRLIKEINDKSLVAMKSSGIELLVSRAAIPGYKPLYGAPAILIISAPNDVPFSPANAASAATTATYAATALGLASCYTITPTMAINADSDLAARVGLSAGNTSFVGVLVGYESPQKNPGTSTPKVVNISFID
jgi:nitroreductase